MITTTKESPRETKKIKDWFGEKNFKIIDLTSKNGWEELDMFLKDSDKKHHGKIIDNKKNSIENIFNKITRELV